MIEMFQNLQFLKKKKKKRGGVAGLKQAPSGDAGVPGRAFTCRCAPVSAYITF